MYIRHRIFIYKEPYYNFAVEIYVPGCKTPSKYMGSNILRDPQYLDEQVGARNDRTKIKWTGKYEKVFKQACIDIYGPMQGTEFIILLWKRIE